MSCAPALSAVARRGAQLTGVRSATGGGGSSQPQVAASLRLPVPPPPATPSRESPLKEAVGLRPPLKGLYARPARRGHAKANPGQAGEERSAVPSLAGSLPPAPAEPAAGERLMTGYGGGGMVNGLKKARRESWVKMLLML